MPYLPGSCVSPKSISDPRVPNYNQGFSCQPVLKEQSIKQRRRYCFKGTVYRTEKKKKNKRGYMVLKEQSIEQRGKRRTEEGILF